MYLLLFKLILIIQINYIVGSSLLRIMDQFALKIFPDVGNISADNIGKLSHCNSIFIQILHYMRLHYPEMLRSENTYFLYYYYYGPQ